jgi:hypothetical protein
MVALQIRWELVLMHYNREKYEATAELNKHVGNPKPSYDEREKLLAKYRRNSMNRVGRITADLVKEVMTGETL